MSIFRRIKSLVSAEANAAIDRMEDPAKMVDEALRQLRTDLIRAKQALAEVKTHQNRLRTEGEKQAARAAEYDRKMIQARELFQAGRMPQEQAVDLVNRAMAAKTAAEKESQTTLATAAEQQGTAEQLQGRIRELESHIAQAEIKRKTLAARSQAATATTKVNEALAGMDSSGALALLSRMEEKVSVQEARAQAVGEIADNAGGLDAQLDRALAAASTPALGSPEAMAFLSGGSAPPARVESGSASEFLQLPAATKETA